MRIVAGVFRGRSLVAPSGMGTRPITDRVKETLFNMLGHHFAQPGELPAIEVLDVFCGPGSLGIEALSRGACRGTFVERDRKALRALRENLRALKLGANSRVMTDNAWTMRVPESDGGYGLIFVDPPYRDAEDAVRVGDLLERLATGLSPDGLLVYRHERHGPVPEDLPSLVCQREREFGRMHILFYAKR